MSTPTLAQAQAAARKLYTDAGVQLITPDDPRRIPVVYAVAAAHAIAKTGVTLAQVEAGFTITLPGSADAAKIVSLASALGPLAGPAVNALLAALASTMSTPASYFSAAAWGDPVACLATAMHELSHVGQLREAAASTQLGEVGEAFWCLDYLAIPEARGAAEAQAYGMTMTVQVLFGMDVAASSAGALASLQSYGLPATEYALAKAMILSTEETLSAGGVVGTVANTVKAALVANGWTP